MGGEPVLRRSQLTGTWRLSGVTAGSDVNAGTAGGMVARPLGRAPGGMLTYTADGWMSVVILPGEESGVPPICYAGRTELANGAVIHIIEVGVAPFSAGTIQFRHARLDAAGDLILLAPVGVAGQEPTAFRWTRVPGNGPNPPAPAMAPSRKTTR